MIVLYVIDNLETKQLSVISDSVMDNKDILSRTFKQTTLGNNPDYYKYVFKKTEKIICAVFYVFRANKDILPEEVLIKNIEDISNKLHKASFSALRATPGQSEWAGKELGYTLMELESALRVAHAGGLLEADLLQVFATEIDSVLRSLKEYAEPKVQNPFFELGTIAVTEPKVRLRSKPSVVMGGDNLLSDGAGDTTNKESRVDRILQIIKDKGQASIKDISETITDCSEKTIQRELNNLIKDNRILREGERRWSKYMLV